MIERVIINPLTKDVQSQLRKKKYVFKARTEGENALAAAVAAKEKSDLATLAAQPAATATAALTASGTAAATSTATSSSSVSTTDDEPLAKAARVEGSTPKVVQVEEQCSVPVTGVTLGIPLGDDELTASNMKFQVARKEEKKEEITAAVVASAEPIAATAVTEAVAEVAAVQQTSSSAADHIRTTQAKKEEGKRDYNFTAYPQKMKLVDFSNKVYIAPLTTVGNLPWRRVMKDFGADITCGEMAMSHNLVLGQASEWARIRRHTSEDCFGIQIAGGQPEHIAKIAKLLENETSSDFVDLNCGCPLDTICNR